MKKTISVVLLMFYSSLSLADLPEWGLVKKTSLKSFNLKCEYKAFVLDQAKRTEAIYFPHVMKNEQLRMSHAQGGMYYVDKSNTSVLVEVWNPKGKTKSRPIQLYKRCSTHEKASVSEQ